MNICIKFNNYSKELESIKKELQTLPAGRLVKRRKFYSHVVDEKGVGITADTALIDQLGRKKYLLARQKQLTNNNSTLERAINKQDDTSQAKIIDSLPETYRQLPKTCFFHPSVKDWITEPYPSNPYKVEDLIYTTKKGIRVRSKSEVFIANLLEEYIIPYRYDAVLRLGGKVIYPDFTIKNPYNGKIIIWEHFGALHQPGYEQKMTDKIKLYTNNGYIPFDTLIYTFEFDIQNPRRLQDLIKNIILL